MEHELKSIVKLSPVAARIMRWLLKATSKDHYRPRLECVNINCEKGIAESTNGFFVHAVETKALLPPSLLQNGTQRVLCIGRYLETYDYSMYSMEYPNIARIAQRKDEPIVVAVDVKFLRETISGMTGPVLLRVFTKESPIEIVGRIDAGGGIPVARCFALIMPMNYEDKDPFLPYKKATEFEPKSEEVKNVLNNPSV